MGLGRTRAMLVAKYLYSSADLPACAETLLDGQALDADARPAGDPVDLVERR